MKNTACPVKLEAERAGLPILQPESLRDPEVQAELRSFGADLIEMETSSFTLMVDLLEKPGISLLVVSDNSATGTALVGRTEEEQRQYDYGRLTVLPEMILSLAAQK